MFLPLLTGWDLTRFLKGANPLNTGLNPICHLPSLLGTHRIFHVSGIRVTAQYNSANPEAGYPVLTIITNGRIFMKFGI
jgi:hypothetical protein